MPERQAPSQQPEREAITHSFTLPLKSAQIRKNTILAAPAAAGLGTFFLGGGGVFLLPRKKAKINLS